MSKNSKANHLINSSSPYLLQHAYNPVEWYPWGEEALKKAKAEDKPILVSIGYSSCHWCHVMERESFENDSIAALMNKHFINIKVDREERPDVDQIYMDAVQAMGQNGGWPLNVFLTPDQKPFYGGTYFPPQGWAQLLQNVAQAFATKRKEIDASADQLTDALSTSELIKYNLTSNENGFSKEQVDSLYQKLLKRFDKKRGGFDRAPKFPMPGNWQLLLEYYHYTNDKAALDQLILTLDEIAKGGIYDQASGGFARYSVDADWLVPHFEKMLYDNGQLLSLYSNAYKLTKKPLYKKVVEQTVEWLQREMAEGNGGFYSALDADSEGVEGKFYVWTKAEFDDVVGKNSGLLSKYYNVTDTGNWEHGNNILHMTASDEQFAQKEGVTIEALNQIVNEGNELLLAARSKRVRPGLDDKVLSGWNGMSIKGLCDAYDAFGDDTFLELAVSNGQFIKNSMIEDGKLFRSFKNDKASIDGYLEDYAFVIDAFVALYQSTFDEVWIQEAKILMEYINTNFYDSDENFYHFTDNQSEKLIARKKEVFDNVIPSSNSQMARNLYVLGIILDNDTYKSRAHSMASAVAKLCVEEPAYTYNWCSLNSMFAYQTAEIVIVGNEAEKFREDIASRYLPNKVLLGSKQESELPLLKGKSLKNGQTTIFVCYNKTCKLPVTDVESALKQLK
ncbi:thioredoxin domain-containing protein [Fulvivirga lutea]|uniref:Thioredoxin domain-containing protein n=2 Tax=Fulvivirga lutea TaxID=2810512 RepID=A0A975A2G1_9BACT|nr:thioredoxin domain-containing protein [Fulvivirga lutea]QSE99426.1 thioredoxin domain-containing protein [Fulvivirga lutea]